MSGRRAGLWTVGAVALLALGLVVVSRWAGGRGDRMLNVSAGGPSVPGEVPPSPPADTRLPVPDDPTVRPTVPRPTTTRPDDSVRSSPPLPPAPNPTLPSPDPSLAACQVDGVRVTVTPEKPIYARGETVRWSSTIENRSATTCLMSGRAFFHVENSAGKAVGTFAYTANYMLPVKAEPGRTITNSGTWDQKDCTGPACVQVPAGTYVVVAGWTEGGPYLGRGSFQITG